MSRYVDRIDLHIDLDVLDPSPAPANTYARGNGLTSEQMVRAIELIAARLEIGALDITAYDPECDPEGKLLPVAFDLIGRVVALCSTRR